MQSKSVRYVLLDECWIYQKGLIREALGRTHDTYNRMSFLVSQGGTQDDEFDQYSAKGIQKVYHWKCPECNSLNKWRWGNIKYTRVVDENGKIDIPASMKTTHMECPCCKAKFEDNALTRRKLANNSEYVTMGDPDKAMPEHITYTFNALCIYRIQWSNLVGEYLNAMQELSDKGNAQPYQQFVQKRLAKNWQELYQYNESKLEIKNTSDYELEVDELDWERTRIMVADTQGQDGEYYFWVTIRAWGTDPLRSRLIYEGRVNSIADLEALNERYNIPPQSTYIDIAWQEQDSTAIVDMCAKNKWYGLDGRSRPNGYPHGNGVVKQYSKPHKKLTKQGVMYYYQYDGDFYKNMLATAKTGNSFKWEVSDRASKIYFKQMSSEVQKKQTNGKYKWVAIRKDNHLWDCETMMMVAGNIRKLI